MDEIETLGASLVAISPQVPEKNAEMARKHKLSFPILSDPGNAWASQLGLTFTLEENLREVYRSFQLNLPEYNGDDSWQLPLPARIVIGRDGKIRDIESDPDYTVRPEPEQTLEVLRSL